MLLTRYKFVFFICALSVFICCSPIAFRPTAEDAEFAKKKWENSSVEHLNEGFQLYKSKCSGCHFLPVPNEYTEKKWLETMPEMGEKSHLSPEEYDLVLKYAITKSNTLVRKK